MPKSFLIKRVHEVNTGFFPWNRETLVPGCCLEYEEEESEDDRSEKHYGGSSDDESTTMSEIRVLAPFNRIMSSPRLILTTACDNEEKECCSSDIHKEEYPLIPSPLGSVNSCHDRMSPMSNAAYTETTFPAHPFPTLKPPCVMSMERGYLSPWHVGSLANRKRHQCEFCLKWFDRSSSLSNHRLIHKNAKTFKCSQCNMSFLRKSDLGKHMVTHSGSKPYQCNVCGKRFSQSSNMLTHQRRHTGIRPYSCEVCGKSFYRKVDVRRHASVHRTY